ncbi:MAG: adenosylcobinamide-GDP ribazoletransferase [Bacillota bacterium]|jgi:adenosylcobinamide-GDP ribazoletransferase
MWKDFLFLISFMSRIPIKTDWGIKEEDWSRCLRLLPLWGLLLGVLVAGVAAVISGINAPVAAACAVAASAFLTGGLHLDGVMDTADGLASGNDREKAFRFMSDAHIGAMGIISLLILLMLKYVLYLFLIVNVQVWWVLPAGVVFSRFMLVFVVYAFPNAKKTGLAATFHKYFEKKYFIVALFLTVIILLFFGNWLAILAAVFAAIFAYFVAHSWCGRWGGLTGDAYGSLTEWSEIIFLLLYLFAVAVAGNLPLLL